MRRRLRRRPAPLTALTRKTTYGKPPGHQLGGLRVVPLGKGRYRPRSYRAGWVGTLYPSSAPAGAPAAPGRSALSLLRCGERPGGTLMSLPEGIATPAPARLGASCGGAVSSVVTSGCPKRSEGGCPCRNEDVRRPSPKPNALSKRNKRSG